MKEYKYTINGNKYEVVISDITENIATLTVNGDVKAPLPGVITDICVTEGQEVAVGDTVVVLEAMKMANALQAEKSGKISAIVVKVGQSVMEDEALVYIE